MESQAYYTTWEDYVKEHPEIANENYHADIMQAYEEGLYKFIIGLLIYEKEK